MPNWCMNRLKVSGKTEEVQKFVKKANPLAQFFTGLLPCPETLLAIEAGSHELYYDILYTENTSETAEETLKEAAVRFGHTVKEAKEIASRYKQNIDAHGHKTWYSWCICNWGTKWDVEAKITEQHEEEDCSFVVFEFDSAWTSPEEAIIKIAANYPELEFDLEYYEPNMDFGGRLLIRNIFVEFEDTIQLTGMTIDDSADFPFAWGMLTLAREEENEWRKLEEARNET